jgi:hypothetical protein
LYRLKINSNNNRRLVLLKYFQEMETPKHNPDGDEGRMSAALAEPEQTALDIIRTETVLSRLPIHNLSKKGSITIQIIKKTDAGEVELLWKVSPSRDYGEPRQLAYKLDTIVVNQRVDEAGRPLPKVLKLGSLTEICREMGAAASGKNKADLKKAFMQNVGALITAKFNYKANDGTERRLEAGFTRYGVIFTGEKLPDGRKADAVYVIFNDPFWEVLNNAPVRPLDRAYMKQLPPAAQRFYEIISRKIFAALKNNYPSAKLSYSEYCTFSAQLRHFGRQPIQDQMAKVLRPHKKSGYITSVKYEPTVDAQNQPDWFMYFTPGPTARAEFAAVHRGHKLPAGIEPIEPGETAAVRAPAARRTTRDSKPAPADPRPRAPSVNPEHLAALTSRGVTEDQAREHLANLPADYPLIDTLEWAAAEVARNPEKWDNPAGWYVKLVKERTTPPVTYETRAERQAREEEYRRREDEREAKAARERAAEEAEEDALNRLKASDPERYARFYQEVKTSLYEQFPKLAEWGRGDSNAHVGMIRAKMKRILREAGESHEPPVA